MHCQTVALTPSGKLVCVFLECTHHIDSWTQDIFAALTDVDSCLTQTCDAANARIRQSILIEVRNPTQTTLVGCGFPMARFTS